MSGHELADIKVMEVPMTPEGANARAVLREIEAMLENLIKQGEASSIDLRSLPMSPHDYAVLRETLGEGEVIAELESMGVTEVQETGIPGVWWISHYNPDGETIAEFIEVTYCPEIIITPEEDVREGFEALRARLLEDEYLPGAKGRPDDA